MPKFNISVSYPLSVERAYQKQLQALVASLSFAFEHFLKKRNLPKVTLDEDDVFIFTHNLEKLVSSMQRQYTGEVADEIVGKFIRESYAYSVQDVESIVRDDSFSELIPGIKASDAEMNYLKGKLSENMSYIKSLGDDHSNKIQDILLRGMTQGKSPGDISAEIQKATEMSMKRANLIARNETSSMYGALSKFKQQDAGITHFRWVTAEDSRVRDEHRKLDDKVFTWERGWDGVFPGEPINCRCIAEPLFDDELADIDPDDLWEENQETRYNVDVSEFEDYVTNNGDLMEIYLNSFRKKNTPKSSQQVSDKMEEWFLKNFDAGMLTEAEMTALEVYSGSDYSIINSVLRGVVPMNSPKAKTKDNLAVSDIVKQLDNAISKSELTKNMAFLRIVNDDELRHFINEIEARNPLDAFTSVSTNLKVTMPDKKHKIKFLVPSGKGIGAWVAEHSEYPKQKEFLLKRGITFKIVDRETNKKGEILLTVEVIDNENL